MAYWDLESIAREIIGTATEINSTFNFSANQLVTYIPLIIRPVNVKNIRRFRPKSRRLSMPDTPL